jgi:alpha-galactosidase/6-phospho-beta-glucosidase family protein
MPLSTEMLFQDIENSKSTIMFRYREHIIEEILRNSIGDRFEKALEQNPAIYSADFIAHTGRIKDVDRT